LAEDPDSPGSLGIAIGEAVEIAIKDERTNYALGSVLNHVMLHQTIIGIESMAQMEMADDYPDIVIGCVGGGSNFAGIAFPYIGNKLRGGRDVRIIAVEPAICPTLTRGAYAYDYGDTAHLTPLVKMYTLGSRFMPPPIHAGGLRYHGMAPLVSHVHKLGLVEARSETQLECLKAGMDFARAEGIIHAPEATHAVKATIDEALRCKEEGVSKTILFNLSGHGHFDMQAYLDYQEGRLQNVVHSDEALVKSLQELPQVDM
jgi:tryptophan synthase beta chain